MPKDVASSMGSIVPVARVTEVMPAFGQTAFGPNRIWPKKSEFGQLVFVTAFVQTAFGQIWCFFFCFGQIFCCCCCSWLVPVGACWCLLVRACWCCCLCVWWVCSRFLGLSRRTAPAGPPFPWTAQNFALFFSLSRRKILSFFSLWRGVFSLNFGGVFEDRGAQMCTLGLSGPSNNPHSLPKKQNVLLLSGEVGPLAPECDTQQHDVFSDHSGKTALNFLTTRTIQSSAQQSTTSIKKKRFEEHITCQMSKLSRLKARMPKLIHHLMGSGGIQVHPKPPPNHFHPKTTFIPTTVGHARIWTNRIWSKPH